MLRQLSFLLLIYSCKGHRDCEDCVLVTECPKGVDHLTKIWDKQEVDDMFKNAICGFQKGKNSGPKVCCSYFDNVETITHPNLKLLPKSCGDIDGGRVVGGTIANLYEFPWMALISYSSGQSKEFDCAGTILNSRYILTAAHCVKYKSIAGVRIGEYDIRYSQDCVGEGESFVCESNLQDIEVESEIIHQDFRFNRHGSDIALLRLSTNIDLTQRNAKPICLPISKKLQSTRTDNKIGTVAGWGLTEYHEYSNVLLKVNVTIHGSCSGGRHNQETEFCAGDPKKDSCKGDSGGPLMLEDVYNGAFKMIQYGIVSRGPDDCGSGTGGVYTDVTKYIDWILNNISR